jgi:hypothetical protein
MDGLYDAPDDPLAEEVDFDDVASRASDDEDE